MDLRTWNLVHDLARAKTYHDQKPTYPEVVAFLTTAFPGAEKWAEQFYRAMLRQGWKDKKREQIKDWRALAKRYASRAYLRSQKDDRP